MEKMIDKAIILSFTTLCLKEKYCCVWSGEEIWNNEITQFALFTWNEWKSIHKIWIWM